MWEPNCFTLIFFFSQPDGKLDNSSIKCHEPSCIASSKCLISQGLAKLHLSSVSFFWLSTGKVGAKIQLLAWLFLAFRIFTQQRKSSFTAWRKLFSCHQVHDSGNLKVSFTISIYLNQLGREVPSLCCKFKNQPYLLWSQLKNRVKSRTLQKIIIMLRDLHWPPFQLILC